MECVGSEGGRDTVPQHQPGRESASQNSTGQDKRSSLYQHKAYTDCEGSHMPREARVSEASVPITDAFHTQRNGAISETQGYDATLSNGQGCSSLGERLVAERGKRYGHPSVNYRRIGIMWQAILDLPEPVPPPLVGLMLKGVKLGRLVNAPFDEDGLDDMDGYTEAQRELGRTWDA